MTDFVFLILFGLSLLFPCEGGSTARIVWSFDDDIETLSYRKFAFSDGRQSVLLATIYGDEDPKQTSLFDIAVEKPATLVLKNVNQTYTGTYQFSLLSSTGDSISDVVVLIAVTPILTVECSRSSTLDVGDDILCICRGLGGHPPARVTWFKGNKQKSGTGKEKQILRITNCNKDDSGTYRCVAESHEEAKNETTIKLVVNYPPENVKLTLARNGKAATIKCTADAQPPASFKIFLTINKTKLVKGYEMYAISEVRSSDVGNYTCVAENKLGNKDSNSEYLSLEEPLAIHPTTISSQITTTTKGNESDKASSNDSCNCRTELYSVVSLVSGIIIGILFTNIVSCARRQFRRKKPQPNPELQTEVDTTYQELDLTRMNAEDNYQSLRVNSASDDAANNDDSNYAELSQTRARDVENNYQSLT